MGKILCGRVASTLVLTVALIGTCGAQIEDPLRTNKPEPPKAPRQKIERIHPTAKACLIIADSAKEGISAAESDVRVPFGDIVDVLIMRFREAVRVQEIDDVAKVGCSIAFVITGFEVKIPLFNFISTDVIIKADIADAKGGVLDTLSIVGEKGSWGASSYQAMFDPAWRVALAAFGTALDKSAKLKSYAASLPAEIEQTSGAASAAAVDMAFWDSIKGSNNPTDMQAYLQRFPKGNFAALARARIKELGEVAPARFAPVAVSSSNIAAFGTYHALVIGNNGYRHLEKLQTAATDAKGVAALLEKAYGFKVKMLLDATRGEILDAFDDFRRTLTVNDNLLIYYAGHGYLDGDSDRGFWLPVDADRTRRANWLSNADISDMVRATMAKHVLVVADSCYAGTLTRSVNMQVAGLDDMARLAQKRARTVLTSGGLEPVADSGGGQHSVFAKAFLDLLQSNSGIIDMSQVFSAMRRQVILGAQQTPQYSDMRQTGHEGGDFIFVRRQ